MNEQERERSDGRGWISKELNREEGDEDEGERPEESMGKLVADISEEVALLPPLLPLKFGNGLLLQYTVNQPGIDDRFGLLELGLATGLSSLALVLVSASSSYLFKTAPQVMGVSKEKRRGVAKVLKICNRVVGGIQICLLILLFLYTVSHYTAADFEDSESEHYVKKRIFMFSLIVSSVMFGSLIVTFSIAGFIYFRQNPSNAVPSQVATSQLPPPARSLMPLGLANALLGLYIGIPGDDAQVVGPSVFLLDLCLYVGTITILLTVLESVGRVALIASMRDGVLDGEEEKIVKSLHMTRYAMALAQLLMFAIMWGHALEVYAKTGLHEYLCPRNLLLICLLLSSSVLLAGLVAGSLCLYLVV